MFVHKYRRIDDDNNIYDLLGVLTKETSLSKYLNKYEITFKDEQDVKVFVANKKIDIDKFKYFKQRFEYNSFIGGYLLVMD